MKDEIRILSPLSGRAVSLDEVPDPVFSDRVLGDGCAVIPTDGRIYSPVNGVVTSVAETGHAYGFLAEDGAEVLVHFGLETVALKGSGFTLHIKEGDRVKAGDLIAEADIQLLRESGAQLITPVLVCGGGDVYNRRNKCRTKERSRWV